MPAKDRPPVRRQPGEVIRLTRLVPENPGRDVADSAQADVRKLACDPCQSRLRAGTRELCTYVAGRGRRLYRSPDARHSARKRAGGPLHHGPGWMAARCSLTSSRSGGQNAAAVIAMLETTEETGHGPSANPHRLEPIRGDPAGKGGRVIQTRNRSPSRVFIDDPMSTRARGRPDGIRRIEAEGMVVARRMETASSVIGAEASGRFLHGGVDIDRKMNQMLERRSIRYSNCAGNSSVPAGSRMAQQRAKKDCELGLTTRPKGWPKLPQ